MGRDRRLGPTPHSPRPCPGPVGGDLRRGGGGGEPVWPLSDQAGGRRGSAGRAPFEPAGTGRGRRGRGKGPGARRKEEMPRGRGEHAGAERGPAGHLRRLEGGP